MSSGSVPSAMAGFNGKTEPALCASMASDRACSSSSTQAAVLECFCGAADVTKCMRLAVNH